MKSRDDKEINLVNKLRLLSKNEIYYIPESTKVKRVANDVIFIDEWEKYWTDNSEDTNNPPDFYSDKLSIMMDVMRVTDKEVKSGKNPTLAKESKVLKEIEESGILSMFPNVTEDDIFLNCDSGLPTDKDHNFKAYRRQFERTINKHSSKVETYKRNHPKIKRNVFFIFDESTDYLIPENPKDEYKKGDIVKVHSKNIHIWFRDKFFIDLIINSNADYVIWYAPYKTLSEKSFYAHLNKNVDFYLPKAVILDCKYHETINNLMEYDADLMRSTEV